MPSQAPKTKVIPLTLPQLPPQKRNRKQSSSANTLPTLRLLLRPTPGVGLDARLPLNRYLRCYLSIESYFQKTSLSRIGIEINRFPLIRFEIAPRATISLRLPHVRISEFKFIHFGIKTLLLPFPTTRNLWHRASRPVLEIQHCHTLLGTLLDDRQRRALREVLEELRTRSPSLPNRTALPNVDPRELPDPLAVLRERLEKRGVNRSSFGGPSESIKDKFLKRYSPRGLLGGERGAGKEASGEDTSGGNEGLESDRQEAHE